MSTFTPGATALSLVAPSVSTTMGAIKRFPYPLNALMVVPAVSVAFTQTPSAVPVQVSAPSVLLTLGYPVSPASLVLSAPSVSVTVGAGPAQTLVPDAAFLSASVPSPVALVDQSVTPSPALLPILPASPSLTLGELTLSASEASLPMVAADPTVALSLDLFPDPSGVAVAVLEPAALVDIELYPSPVELLTVAVLMDGFLPLVLVGEIDLFPDPASLSGAVPSPSVLPGEKVLQVDPTLLTASVGGPVVTEGVGQTNAPCLINDRPEVKCMINVSEVAYVETNPE